VLLDVLVDLLDELSHHLATKLGCKTLQELAQSLDSLDDDFTDSTGGLRSPFTDVAHSSSDMTNSTFDVLYRTPPVRDMGVWAPAMPASCTLLIKVDWCLFGLVKLFKLGTLVLVHGLHGEPAQLLGVHLSHLLEGEHRAHFGVAILVLEQLDEVGFHALPGLVGGHSFELSEHVLCVHIVVVVLRLGKLGRRLDEVLGNGGILRC